MRKTIRFNSGEKKKIIKETNQKQTKLIVITILTFLWTIYMIHANA
jgi:hypothetical protein